MIESILLKDPIIKEIEDFLDIKRPVTAIYWERIKSDIMKLYEKGYLRNSFSVVW